MHLYDMKNDFPFGVTDVVYDGVVDLPDAVHDGVVDLPDVVYDGVVDLPDVVHDSVVVEPPILSQGNRQVFLHALNYKNQAITTRMKTLYF